MTVLFHVEYLQDYIDNELPKLDYAVENDACIDLRSVEKAIMDYGDIYLFRTGIKVEIPEKHVMLIFSRSGKAVEGLHMANGVGVIDPGYRGEIKVPLKYLPESINKDDFYIVDIGDRIAQFMIQPVELMRPIPTASVNKTTRGEGGFGHTGK
jgi:dUTP pyrophosphatase